MEVYLKNDIEERLKKRSIHLFFEPLMQNESVTSWICRNALSNYSSPTDFVGNWLNKHLASHYDFDLNPIDDIINWIVWMSPKREVDKLSFKVVNLEEAFSYRKVKNSPFIPEGTIHQKRRYPVQFCPGCLDKKQPYFKLDWKINLVYGCELCKCYLASKCSQCENPHQLTKIQLIRHNQCFSKVSDCSFCNAPLNKIKTESIGEQELETLVWMKGIIGLTQNPNPVKASLLIDLCSLLCSSSFLGSISRDYFKIDQPTSNSFYLILAQEKALLIETARVWIENFYNITADINQIYSISRQHWDRFVNSPDGTLNPF